ncbi:hypothetical protein ACFOWM_07590 [Ferruginibacter yonginensis]|uniref:Uncharacterized protein n=1 Tax=Ferruginibacter yonginensis TaxID=1310416 RepID=A0ABV8QRM7_9BACT
MKHKAIILHIITYLILFSSNGTANTPYIPTKKISLVRNGIIQFSCFNHQYKLNVIMVKKPNDKGYDITSAVNNNQQNILISLTHTNNGVQPFLNQQNQSSIWLNNKTYLLNNGQIELTAEGKILSGAFNAKLFEEDGKGGYKTSTTQHINGSFSGIIIP